MQYDGSGSGEGLLVLGGNGCLGTATLDAILKHRGPIRHAPIITASRGRHDWTLPREVEEQQHHVRVNRKKKRHLQALRRVLLQQGERKGVRRWSVVDFSGYKPEWIESVFEEALNGLDVSHYIFISTDSVYEVCQGAREREKLKDADAYVHENAAVRPRHKKARRQLRKRDKYGYEKFKAEEMLQKHCRRRRIPHLLLRLADVVGPRDSTDRFLAHQAHAVAAGRMASLPFFVPHDEQQKRIRVVYSNDVGCLISRLLLNPASVAPHAWHSHNAINLACEEVVTVCELVNTVASACGNTTLRVQPSSSAVQYYPSITGPPVAIDRAKRLLAWKPTPLPQAIRETCAFYFQNTHEPELVSGVCEWRCDLQTTLQEMAGAGASTGSRSNHSNGSAEDDSKHVPKRRKDREKETRAATDASRLVPPSARDVVEWFKAHDARE